VIAIMTDRPYTVGAGAASSDLGPMLGYPYPFLNSGGDRTGGEAVSDPGIFRIPHQVWQRANVNAAAAYLREVLAQDPANVRVKALLEGLQDVLDPTRRVARLQRELARATDRAAAERRRAERRTGHDRRQRDIQVPEILDRRSGVDRRTGKDRRKA
jgi:erythromycin esterase-like protein